MRGRLLGVSFDVGGLKLENPPPKPGKDLGFFGNTFHKWFYSYHRPRCINPHGYGSGKEIRKSGNR
jgi:hypothetical protein